MLVNNVHKVAAHDCLEGIENHHVAAGEPPERPRGPPVGAAGGGAWKSANGGTPNEVLSTERCSTIFSEEGSHLSFDLVKGAV